MKRYQFTALLLCLVIFLSSCSATMVKSPLENAILEEASTLSTGENESFATLPDVTETGEKKPIPNQANPANDNTLNILIIGNSASTGWPDELNGLLSSAGVKANIFTVYYSGCSLAMHWNWLQNSRSNYRLRHHIQGGGISDDTPVGLEFCLRQRNWDVISLQQSYHPTVVNNFDYDTFHQNTNTTAKHLFNYLKERFPKSSLVWFETWSYNIGWSREDKKIDDLEDQLRMYEHIQKSAAAIATENGVPVVPCGDAWTIARENPKIGDLTRDGYHDGPAGGGQYLNACVWFEFLTGQSCVGNTYRPSALTIDEEAVAVLQNAAHEAIQNNAFPRT